MGRILTMAETKRKHSKVNQAVQTQAAVADYVTVEAFIRSAKTIYPMTAMQVAGFKNTMASKGMKSAPNLEFYLPYLKSYLGIKD